MKSIHDPIRVRLDDRGQPCAWRWRGRPWWVLRILDRWVLQARWWTGRPERRDYLLVEAAPDPVREADHLQHQADSADQRRADHLQRRALSAEQRDRAPVGVWSLGGAAPRGGDGDADPTCAVEIYRRRLGGAVDAGQETWILARILT